MPRPSGNPLKSPTEFITHTSLAVRRQLLQDQYRVGAAELPWRQEDRVPPVCFHFDVPSSLKADTDEDRAQMGSVHGKESDVTARASHLRRNSKGERRKRTRTSGGVAEDPSSLTASHHPGAHQRSRSGFLNDGVHPLCTSSDNMNNAHNVKTAGTSAYRHEVLRPCASLTCHDVRVVRLKVGIDKRLTSIDEKSPAVLKYRTPHFRAMATVEIPVLSDQQSVQIGWIQVCTDMQFINVYDHEGFTSWEFPEIVSNKYRMISDSDGKEYPWYGSKHEVQTVEGPTTIPTTVTVHMNDNFFPQVTWHIPYGSHYSREPLLTRIYRKQKFFTYLVLKDNNSDVYHTLKTVSWSMELDIDVNPQMELGKRAQLLGPAQQDSPRILDSSNNPQLETYAMKPPNANNSQVLIWRPKTGDAKIIVPPIETTMDMKSYLQTTAYQRHLMHNFTRSRS